MMESLSYSDIVRGLRQIGLKSGDIVNVHSRLFSIGMIDGIPATKIPETFLRAFQEVIGDEGTIVVPTYTTSFGRYGTPFVLEDSPSEFGVFSEYIRKSPGAMRTLHPIQSLVALGGAAQALTADHPRWNVGHDTIWDRMQRWGGKVVTLGLPPRKCLSFVHHLELLACVPYLYHKILRGEIFAGGERISDDFYMPVRYLEYGISYDLNRLQADLCEKAAVTKVPLGRDWAWCVSMEDVFERLMKGFRQDPYFLLKDPPSFIDGEIPCDGTTIQREGEEPNYYILG